MVANKAKVRDPSILCCMGLFNSAPCRSYRLRYKATEPPRAAASRKPGGKQTHVVRPHHPAFTPFMEAQLTSLCNHPREKPEKKRTEVALSGCVSAYFQAQFSREWVNQLINLVIVINPSRIFVIWTLIDPWWYAKLPLPVRVEIQGTPYPPIHPHSNLLSTWQKQEKLVKFSKQFQRL